MPTTSRGHPDRHQDAHTLTASQTSRLSFLKFVVLGSLLVPLLAVSGGAAVLGEEPAQSAQVVQAPPAIILALLGVGLVALAVGRRVLKTARG